MAKRLNGSTDGYTHADSTVLRPPFPISVGMWYRAGTGPGNSKYFVSKVGLAGDHPSYALQTNGSGEIRFTIGISLGSGGFTPSAGISTAFTYDGAWHYYTGTYDGADVQIWFDGGLIASQAETAAISYSTEALFVGSFDGSILFAAGDYAEISVWNTKLTTADMASIVAGVSPKLIRPEKMVEYWSMLGPSTEAGEFGGQTLTVSSGAPAVIDHPRIYGRPGRGARKLTTASVAPSNKGRQFMPFFG